MCVSAIDDALSIWQAGVDAVKPANLIANNLSLSDGHLRIQEHEFSLAGIKRIVVVGGGKASAELAIQLHQQILQPLLQVDPQLRIDGWINCPEGAFDSASPAALATQRNIRLFEARPVGINYPTEKAALGTKNILDLVASCCQNTLVICLISGGGSALLAAPITSATLADKQAVAKTVAAAGGNIEELNTIRRALSRIKGGGLARACSAPRMITLIVSDVLGDSLQTIASGPTELGASNSPAAALQVIQKLNLENAVDLQPAIRALESISSTASSTAHCEVHNIILGNNADAVDAAGVKAVELGYRYVMECARESEGEVGSVAEHAHQACTQLMNDSAVDCWISGGEPTVQLPREAGKGGRNQQLALHCLLSLPDAAEVSSVGDLAFVSGGTDGEDGPTDAAGAFFDNKIRAEMLREKAALSGRLERADAYNAFLPFGALLKTGPTGTNVCDLRVALVKRS